MHLPDINVWLALTFDSHIHHPPAKAWFDSLPNDAVCHLCRLTQLGFLRLATNRRIFGKHALTLPKAWQKYDTFLSDARVAFAEEPPQLEAQWRAFTQSRSRSPQVWNDAYLAAFAFVANLKLVRFDKSMSRYPGEACTILP